jgi:glutathione S-transferase
LGNRYYHRPENKEALDRYEKQVYRCYDLLESQLAKSDAKSILPGIKVTAVDVHYYPWVRQEEFMGVSFDKYPLIRKWIANMTNIKEFTDAYDKLQEAAKGEGAENADEKGMILGADKGLMREVGAGRM